MTSGHYQEIDEILHNLIVTQLETARDFPYMYCPTQATRETIDMALLVAKETRDIALLSSFHLYEDQNAVRLSWHHHWHSLAVDVSGEEPHLRHCVEALYEPEHVGVFRRAFGLSPTRQVRRIEMQGSLTLEDLCLRLMPVKDGEE